MFPEDNPHGGFQEPNNTMEEMVLQIFQQSLAENMRTSSCVCWLGNVFVSGFGPP